MGETALQRGLSGSQMLGNFALQGQQATAGQFNADQNRTLTGAGQIANQFTADQGRNLQVNQLLAQLEQAAQQNTAGQFNQDRTALNASGTNLMNLGQNAGNWQQQNISNLMNFGQNERQIQQQPLDFNYQQFTEARDYPQRMLQLRSAALGSSQYPTTQTTETPGASTLQQLLGAGATAAGIYGNLRPSTTFRIG
jgi:hypothetical protein